MSGRITSIDPSRNEFGVPLARVLELERASHRRLTGAMTEALKRWAAADKARREKRDKKIQKALRDAAVQATEKALS